MVGALCNTGSEESSGGGAGHWTLSVGYRYQHSFRHFVGTNEQKQREVLGNQIVNNYHLFDVGVSYQLTPRVSINGSLPMLFAYRNQLYNPRGEYRVRGIGDATVGVRTWIWRPPTESGGNVSLGLSLKMPTGNSDSRSTATTSGGQIVQAVADQSIQAGDGGWGFAVDMQAFRRMPWGSTLYFTGTYLFNPEETSGVPTFRSRPSEAIMSVADQYLYRGGISHPVPKIRGLVGSIGGRIEGVPVHDAFGGSLGFRRPGYSIAVEPGFLYGRGRDTWSFNLPIAVERNRRRSVTDYMDNRHGDAAFADYSITIGYSRRF